MAKYGLISRIGQGAQGVLVKARVIKTGEIVAIKRIHLRADVRSQLDTMREVLTLQNCNHENIIQLLDTFLEDTTASLVMEFVESTLKCVIADVRRPQNDALLVHYFEQLFAGVAYLHHHNIMHRDVKPENILVTRANRIKIADFGLACLYAAESDKTYSHQVVTRWYRAPELLFGSITYDPKVDLWAAGCVLGEYVNGSPLFMGCNDIDQLAIVLSVLGTPDDAAWPGWQSLPDANKIVFEETAAVADFAKIVPSASPAVCELVRSLVQLNPAHRPSATECVYRLRRVKERSPWIAFKYAPPEPASRATGDIVFANEFDFEATVASLAELSIN